MFTGIIKQVATVQAVTPKGAGAQIIVDLGELAADTGRGDSVAVNGACLTVAEKRGTVCVFDAVAETLSKTTLRSLRAGDTVNIEPSLRVGDSLGGHFVLGHVDGVGTLVSLARSGESAELRVAVDATLAAQIVPKGSVAVDGISLTVVRVGPSELTCAIIPTTLEETTLSRRRAGDRVNIETDILGKMVARLLGNPVASSGPTLDTLREAGFA